MATTKRIINFSDAGGKTISSIQSDGKMTVIKFDDDSFIVLRVADGEVVLNAPVDWKQLELFGVITKSEREEHDSEKESVKDDADLSAYLELKEKFEPE